MYDEYLLSRTILLPKTYHPSLSYSSDEQFIAADLDANIIIWFSKTGSVHKILSGHNERIRDFAFIPQTHSLVSVSSDGVKIWDLETAIGENIKLVHNGCCSVSCLAASPDGQYIVLGHFYWDGGGFSLVQRKSGQIIHQQQTKSTIKTVLFSSDGKAIITYDSTIKYWQNEPPFRLLSTHSIDCAELKTCHISNAPDTKEFFFSYVTCPFFYDPATQKMSFCPDENIIQSDYSPNGKLLAYSHENQIKLFNRSDKKFLTPNIFDGKTSAVRFSPTGLYLSCVYATDKYQFLVILKNQALAIARGNKQKQNAKTVVSAD